MMTTKLVAAAAVVAVLAGCHGQDPFKRESDPIKDYPRTSEVATEAYVPGKKPVAPAPAPVTPEGEPIVKTDVAPSKCFEIISVSTEPKHDNLSLKFSENNESTYAVTVSVGGPQNLDLDIQDQRPEGSVFQLISRQGNTLQYNFTWKPLTAGDQKLVISYNSAVAEGACPESKKSVVLNLTVGQSKTAAPKQTEQPKEALASKEAPAVSVSALKEKVTFGEKFDVKVVVQDLSATAEKAPDLQSIKYLKSTQKAGLLNAAKAIVACDEKGRAIGENKYEFLCSFDSNLIPGVDKHLNSGKEAGAGFAVTAISTATGTLSKAVTQKITVVFPKVAADKKAKGAKP